MKENEVSEKFQPTMLEYFAGCALQALVSNEGIGYRPIEEIAKSAYRYALALCDVIDEKGVD